jgi:hypothetical protein
VLLLGAATVYPEDMSFKVSQGLIAVVPESVVQSDVLAGRRPVCNGVDDGAERCRLNSRVDGLLALADLRSVA